MKSCCTHLHTEKLHNLLRLYNIGWEALPTDVHHIVVPISVLSQIRQFQFDGHAIPADEWGVIFFHTFNMNVIGQWNNLALLNFLIIFLVYLEIVQEI
jgi:hypothetical protein